MSINIQYSLATSKVWQISVKSSVTCVGGVRPVTVSLLALCRDALVKFSFEVSMWSVGWHVLWNVTDKGLDEIYVLNGDVNM